MLKQLVMPIHIGIKTSLHKQLCDPFTGPGGERGRTITPANLDLTPCLDPSIYHCMVGILWVGLKMNLDDLNTFGQRD